jgi:hypothetical protein
LYIKIEIKDGVLVKSQILAVIFITLILSSQIHSAEKTTIAVMELETRGGLSYSEAAILSEKVREALFLTGKYTVLDRSSMDEILAEMGFSMSGCTSNECIVKVGRLLSAQNMVAGFVGKIGTTYTMSLRMINVETGEIINMATVDCPGCPLDRVAVEIPGKVVRKLMNEPEMVTNQPKIKPVSTKPAIQAKLKKFIIGLGVRYKFLNTEYWGKGFSLGYRFSNKVELIYEFDGVNKKILDFDGNAIVKVIGLNLLISRYCFFNYQTINSKLYFHISIGSIKEEIIYTGNTFISESGDALGTKENLYIFTGVGLNLFYDKSFSFLLDLAVAKSPHRHFQHTWWYSPYSSFEQEADWSYSGLEISFKTIYSF